MFGMRETHRSYDESGTMREERIREMMSQGAVSTGEAARILGVSDQTVRNMCDEGKLEHFTLPSGHRRIVLSPGMFQQSQPPRIVQGFMF